MNRNRPDPTALFDVEGLWDRFERNPHLEERTRLVLQMIPSTAEKILDVGCGNGVLLRALGNSRATVGLDPSMRGLTTFNHPRICGIGEHLPIRSGSFDLVCCLEVLEHLPNDGVDSCAAEISRVTRRWLLVATPDREDPRRNSLRCPRCGLIFNRSHHLQSFDSERLRKLFPDFTVRQTRRGGQMVRPYAYPLLWVRHRIARRFYRGRAEQQGLCPSCGNREFPPFRANPLSIALDGINRILRRRRPYWILMLLERGPGESIGSI